MPASITQFVDVNITIADAQAEKFSFGTLMFVAEHNVNTQRQSGPFFSVEELNDAGFTAAAAPAMAPSVIAGR